MDGIENKIDPGDPNLGNMYERTLAEVRERGIEILPQSLSEAINELRNDEVIKGSLGVIAEEFIRLKENEWHAYSGQVTEWEISKYLTCF